MDQFHGPFPQAVLEKKIIGEAQGRLGLVLVRGDKQHIVKIKGYFHGETSVYHKS